MEEKSDLQVLIGGPAGMGIMVSGRILGKVALRHGYFTFGYPEYPSLIRGGHNSFAIRFSKSKIKNQKSKINLLVALGKNTIELHKDELEKNAGIIYDPEEISEKNFQFSPRLRSPRVRAQPGGGVESRTGQAIFNYQLLPVSRGKILTELGVPKVTENSVVLGAVVKVLGFDLEVLQKILAEEYADKGEEVIKINQLAAEKGFEAVQQTKKQKNKKTEKQLESEGGRLLITGNEAAALSAIAAGCQAYFAYPMTPSTSILHFLAEQGEKFSMVVLQPEDEIATINMAIGASFAGVRSMIATSGGGFCLMTEGLGLSGMTETPLVIIDSQRSGPTTGMPTWTEQGDLQFVLHAHQSDFPRIVLAPGDAEEVFNLTFEAFNLADKYQLPVIILLDKYLSESLMTIQQFNPSTLLRAGDSTIGRGNILSWEELEEISDYKRYQFTKTSVSPRTLPGQEGGIFRANSDEHDEYGFSTEDKEIRVKMMNKRMKKLNAVAKEIPSPTLFGPENAKVTLVGWGSTKGPIQEAISKLSGKANFLHLNYLWPFPKEAVKKILFMAKKVIILEGNYSGQLHSLIREETGEKADEVFLKYDGRPFYPEEIAESIR